MLQTVIAKLGDHDKRFDSHDRRFDSLEEKVEMSSNQLKILTTQFSEVGIMAIEDNKRISKVEKDIEELQSKAH